MTLSLQDLLRKAVNAEESQIAALQALEKSVQLAEMDHVERKVHVCCVLCYWTLSCVTGHSELFMVHSDF